MKHASTRKAPRPEAGSDDDCPEVDLNDPRWKVLPGRGRALQRRDARYPLALIRTGLKLTQVEVATAAGMAQGDVSRLEKQDDALVSTLRRYAKALGGELEVVVVLPDGKRLRVDI